MGLWESTRQVIPAARSMVGVHRTQVRLSWTSLAGPKASPASAGLQGQLLGPRQTWHYCLEGLRETTARRDGVSVVIQIVELLLLQVAVICVLFSHSKYVTVPKLLLFRSQQRY